VSTSKSPARIRVGVGGWTYEPWRDNFYPSGWPQARELEFAGQALTAIEINSTYHGTQKRTSFAKWRDQTPDGFVFSVKASRYATNRRVLAEAGESIDRFIDSGIAELGDKLGPLVWQFALTKQFETEDFEAFLDRLPAEVEGRPLRHVLEVRHESFMCAQYLALARKYRAATVFTDSDKYPSFADLTGGDLVYARLMRAQAELDSGYPPEAFEPWAGRARAWAAGREPEDLPRVAGKAPGRATKRDVFVFFINGAKERAPAAAQALIRSLG
jgi:uncharacterized protein YecE (DUF72 family)